MKSFISKSALLIISLTSLICVLYLYSAGRNTNNYLRAYEQKCKLLREVESPRIIFIGGSNLAFGLNSQRIKDSLQMNVINYGLHAGMGMRYMIDDIATYAKEGDVLVFAPEYEHFHGDADGESLTLSLLLSCHKEKWASLNLAQMLNVISGMPTAIKMELMPFTPSERSYVASGFNEYGDETNHWTLESIPIKADAIEGKFDTSFASYFVQKITELKQKCKVYIIPPICIESFYQKNIKQIAFITAFLEQADIPFILPTERHTLPDEDGYDTVYHMSKQGVEKYTSSIIEALRQKIE